MGSTATITSKGQVTLPLKVRKVLNTNIVEIEIEGENIILRPVKSVAGALRKYGVKDMDFKEVRNKTWEEIVDADR